VRFIYTFLTMIGACSVGVMVVVAGSILGKWLENLSLYSKELKLAG